MLVLSFVSPKCCIVESSTNHPCLFNNNGRSPNGIDVVYEDNRKKKGTVHGTFPSLKVVVVVIVERTQANRLFF